jgi:hypothetical protein
LDELDAELFQGIFGGDEILSPFDFRASAEGDDRRMLDQKQAFLRTGKDLGVDAFLDRPRFAV